MIVEVINKGNIAVNFIYKYLFIKNLDNKIKSFT